MILVHVLIVLFGVPVLLIAVGCVWLWLGSKVFSAVFSGGG